MVEGKPWVVLVQNVPEDGRIPNAFHRRVFRMIAWFLEEFFHSRADQQSADLTLTTKCLAPETGAIFSKPRRWDAISK